MILLILLGSVYLFLSLIACYVKQIRITKVDKGCIALSAMFLFGFLQFPDETYLGHFFMNSVKKRLYLSRGVSIMYFLDA